MEKPVLGLDLPADLVAFLTAGKQLEFDPEPCEAGAVTLVPLSELKLARFPVETGSLAVYEQDPALPGREVVPRSRRQFSGELHRRLRGGGIAPVVASRAAVRHLGQFALRHSGFWPGGNLGTDRREPGPPTLMPDGRASIRKLRRWNPWCRGRRTHTIIGRCTIHSRPNKALHLTGLASRFFATPRSLQPARQVNAIVRRQTLFALGFWRGRHGSQELLRHPTLRSG